MDAEVLMITVIMRMTTTVVCEVTVFVFLRDTTVAAAAVEKQAQNLEPNSAATRQCDNNIVSEK